MPNPPVFKPPPSFILKKSRILQQLSVPLSEYDDLSPKGSVDVGIRELIDEINGLEGCVTTSSCAGRISVFLEGRRKAEKDEGAMAGEGGNEGAEESASERTAAGVGGKGGGGRWLFVSHDPVEMIEGASCAGGGKRSWVELMGMQRLEGGEEEVRGVMERAVGERRLVHFKFEPMVCCPMFFASVTFYYGKGRMRWLMVVYRSFMSLQRLFSKLKLSSLLLFKQASVRAVR